MPRIASNQRLVARKPGACLEVQLDARRDGIEVVNVEFRRALGAGRVCSHAEPTPCSTHDSGQRVDSARAAKTSVRNGTLDAVVRRG